ncbi:N-acetylglucosamine-6-phosphate deacetylase [Solibacillus sp. MA9]|uniref:N-acetylglucosamine-6-phosphate deacetylase n=1 Tax=Solibacillus palustris TaxID=2908203 RepID=A0ABS9UDP8_9BACL|nr:N-acetylglucosamine-6-phosphate deacetylase [Solibacillus sp. MA9]MCH7322461.1 N-acetylglucosamine-6-phosphate deacetylase [Solibacillus sp. MA9]
METLLITNITIVNCDERKELCDIYIENGKIIDIGQSLKKEATKIIDCKQQSLFLLPGFIDIHIHGANGFDTMDSSQQAIEKISKHLVKEGVTSFLATTMTQSVENIEAALVNLKNYEDHFEGAQLLGAHVEGPFVSVKRAGAQPVEFMQPPSISLLKHWHTLCDGVIKIMTLAPELENGLELVTMLRKLNIIASIGHSDATMEEVQAAVEAGVTQATHLYNQMRPFHHRDPGVVGAALQDDQILVELIVDFIHSHPKAVNLAYKVKGAKRIILITDAMRAKGLPYGEYDLGGQIVYVTENGAHLEDGTLAGSVLTMEQAVKNMKTITNCSLEEIVAMSSSNAAQQLQETTKGRIAVGYEADLVLVDSEVTVCKTIRKGKVVYEKPNMEME